MSAELVGARRLVCGDPHLQKNREDLLSAELVGARRLICGDQHLQKHREGLLSAELACGCRSGRSGSGEIEDARAERSHLRR